jgi:hypothetical protein
MNTKMANQLKNPQRLKQPKSYKLKPYAMDTT